MQSIGFEPSRSLGARARDSPVVISDVRELVRRFRTQRDEVYGRFVIDMGVSSALDLDDKPLYVVAGVDYARNELVASVPEPDSHRTWLGKTRHKQEDGFNALREFFDVDFSFTKEFNLGVYSSHPIFSASFSNLGIGSGIVHEVCLGDVPSIAFEESTFSNMKPTQRPAYKESSLFATLTSMPDYEGVGSRSTGFLVRKHNDAPGSMGFLYESVPVDNRTLALLLSGSPTLLTPCSRLEHLLEAEKKSFSSTKHLDEDLFDYDFIEKSAAGTVSLLFSAIMHEARSEQYGIGLLDQLRAAADQQESQFTRRVADDAIKQILFEIDLYGNRVSN